MLLCTPNKTERLRSAASMLVQRRTVSSEHLQAVPPFCGPVLERVLALPQVDEARFLPLHPDMLVRARCDVLLCVQAYRCP